MARKATLVSLLPLLVIAIVAVSMLRPANASAATYASATSHPHLLGSQSVQPRAIAKAGGGNLTYHKGPIMPGTTLTYAIFWEPTGSYVSPNYNNLLLRYFGDVGSSPLYHNNTQYKDGGGNIPSGSSLGGSWVDTAQYPSGTLTDAQVQGEVSHAMSVNGWTASLTHVFFVFTAKGENICAGSSCSFTTFCAYHYYFGANTLYAAMPYTGTNLAACGVPSSPNGDFDADSTINVTSHEQMEAATDPLVTAWYDTKGNEIGDKCAWHFGGAVVWNGDSYFVQKEWDNAKHGCVLAGP